MPTSWGSAPHPAGGAAPRPHLLGEGCLVALHEATATSLITGEVGGWAATVEAEERLVIVYTTLFRGFGCQLRGAPPHTPLGAQPPDPICWGKAAWWRYMKRLPPASLQGKWAVGRRRLRLRRGWS